MHFSKPNCLRVTVMLLLLSVVATVTATMPQPQERSFQPEKYLPAGQGRDLILQTCVQCHELRNTVSQRKSAAGWKRTVDEMIWRGAPLMTDEAEKVTRYLASSFGPDNPIPDELKGNFPSKKD